MRPIRRLTLLAAVTAVTAAAACVESNRGTLEVTADADSVQVIQGITDTGFVRTAMPGTPVVVVKDSRGFRIPNALVTFTTLTAANGRVQNGVVRSDSLGLARPGAWIAGPDSGTDTLVAYVVGPPGARATRATITARVIDPCARPLPYVLGTSITGTLAGRGCVGADTSLVQPYQFTVAANGLYSFSSSSTVFPSTIELVRENGFPIGIFDGDPRQGATLRAALTPGTYVVRPGAFARPTAQGAFTLSSGPGTVPVGCLPGSQAQAFMTPSTSVSTSLTSDDCQGQLPIQQIFSGATNFDVYAMYVPAGQQYVVRMQSNQLDAILVLYGGNGDPLQANDNGGGGTNASLSFTATRLGAPPGSGALAFVLATSKAQLGGYTLSVDALSP
ncbi:MAG: PPC domain-containing protein [Gemmatimonadaceae bacterium]|nr:PPC domain-containing protein [Gemmatimonadaceae bacterium]